MPRLLEVCECLHARLQASREVLQLLRSLPGSGWLVEWARRCGDPFRGEPGEPLQAGDRAARAYAEAVQHLTERGLGQEVDILLQGHVAKGFAKQPYWTLAPAARKFLQELHVPAWSFSLHMYEPASKPAEPGVAEELLSRLEASLRGTASVAGCVEGEVTHVRTQPCPNVDREKAEGQRQGRAMQCIALPP